MKIWHLCMMRVCMLDMCSVVWSNIDCTHSSLSKASTHEKLAPRLMHIRMQRSLQISSYIHLSHTMASMLVSAMQWHTIHSFKAFTLTKLEATLSDLWKLYISSMILVCLGGGAINGKILFLKIGVYAVIVLFRDAWRSHDLNVTITWHAQNSYSPVFFVYCSCNK